MPSESESQADEARTAKTGAAQTRDVWATIGKVGTLIGALVGAIALYNFVYPRGPRVSAECQLTDIAPYLRQGEKVALDRLRDALKLAGLKPPPESALQAAQLSYKWFSVTALQCRLMNEGSEPASDVALQLPAQPVYAAVNNENLEPGTIKNRSLLLGTLPAGPTTSVHMWFESDRRSFDDQIFLNYRGGKGTVYVGKTYYGFSAAVAEFWQIFGWFSVVIVIFTGFVLALLVFGLARALIAQKVKR